MLDHLVDMGISVPEKAIRTVAVYACILLLLHLAGKRELAALNSFDLVVLLLLSNVVQNAIIGDDLSLVGGLLGAAILVAINYLLVRYAFLHPRVGGVLQGRGRTLVEGGRLDSDALRRERITPAELESVLRRQGVDGLAAVDRVVLEPEGTITPYAKEQPGLDDVLAVLRRIEAKLG
jgi:uncharacterized membrane protein YcaP (DUF421 family)